MTISPMIDAVLFADPKKSTVDIVQAAGRSLRKNPGKKLGYIVVPLFHNEVEHIESDIKNGAYNCSIITEEMVYNKRILIIK